MHKHCLFTRAVCLSWFCLLMWLWPILLQAQTSVITTEAGTNYNGTDWPNFPYSVAFVVENTNSYPVNLQQVDGFFMHYHHEAVAMLWYSATSLSGPVFTAPPAWLKIAESPPLIITANGYYPVFTGLNFTIPANTQYRFVLQSSKGIRSSTGVSPTLFTNAGVTLKVHSEQIGGQSVGYSGVPGSINNSIKAFTGRIYFEAATSCTGLPAPGVVSALPAAPCIGHLFRLSLNGYTAGSGVTYQWQRSGTGAPGSFTNITGATQPHLNITQLADTYYRVLTTCSGSGTVASAILFVNSPAPFPAGTYTINANLPTGNGNFQSFNEAVAAISCGIGGQVTFEVAAGTTYNEQVEIPQIGGAGPTSRVIFNGNGASIGFTAVNDTTSHVIRLNRADYITLNNLSIYANSLPTGLPGNYASAYGIHLYRDADYNHITNNFIHGDTGLAFFLPPAMGIVANPSKSEFTIDGPAANYNLIKGNTITGGGRAIWLMGGLVFSPYGKANKIIDNILVDNISVGVAINFQDSLLVSGNDYSRPTKVLYDGAAFVSNHIQNCIFEKNRIHDVFAGDTLSTGKFTGIANSGTGLVQKNNVVQNNLIYNIKSNGEFRCFTGGNSGNIAFLHNTVNIDYPSGTAGKVYGFASVDLNVSNPSVFRNNIIRINKGGADGKYGVAKLNQVSPISENNVLHITGPNAHIGFQNNTSYTTLADWQALGYDLQSVAHDPQFANPTTLDFNFTNPLLDNTAAPLGVTHDYPGTARNLASPDPGAFETNIPVPCPTPVQVTAINIDSTQATITWLPDTTSGDFTLYYGPAGFTMPGGIIIPGIPTPPFTLTDLDPNSQYQVFVQNECGVTGASAYSVPGVFTTVSCPVPVISGTNAICFSGAPVLQLQGFASGASIQWQQAFSATGPFVSVSGATAATYTASLPITQTTWYRAFVNCGNGPVYSNAMEVTVYNPEIISTNTPVQLCAPGTAVLTATATQGNVNWYSAATGGTSLFTGTTYTPAVTTSATYYAEAALLVNGAGCALPRMPVDVVLSPVDPVTILASADEICAGEAVVLSVANPLAGLTYFWSNGVADSLITINPITTTVYSLTAFNAGCSATANITIGVNPLAEAQIFPSSPQSICAGQSIHLNAAQSTGSTFSWLQNGQPVPGANGLVFAASSQGNYQLVASHNGLCADTSAAVAVTVSPTPVATVSASGPLVFCEGDSVTLTAAQNSGVTYQWLQNNEQLLGATGTEITVYSPGNYQLVLTENTCADTSAATLVEVNLLPTVAITQIPGPNCPDPVTLLASGAGSYVWSTGATTAQITAQAATGNFYSVTGQNQQGCSGSDSVTVAFPVCAETEPVPNIITPNNDGVNDALLIPLPGQQFDLKVFNRWGKEVFSRKNYQQQQNWQADGLADGLYFYFIKTTSGEEYKGWLEVVR